MRPVPSRGDTGCCSSFFFDPSEFDRRIPLISLPG